MSELTNDWREHLDGRLVSLVAGRAVVREHAVEGYEELLRAKTAQATTAGIEPSPLNERLFPFQADLVRWALRRGRAAIFADTGLGKSFQLLEWSRQVSEQVGPVLVLSPLAVVEQTAREGEKFGIKALAAREPVDAAITITNYEMLDHFDPSAYSGVVIDESSRLKAYDGATRNQIIRAFRDTPYRLACTATPAPNDHTELGNHSEFLGIKTRGEMLSEFFVHDGGSTQSWRLKGHAVDPFWRWVCSWGAIVRKPSDLGYSNDGFDLPPLRMHEHIVKANHRDAWGEGMLFAPPALSLSDQRATRRMTMDKRADLAATLTAGDEPAVVWCELNAEADEVERRIDGAVQVKGSDSSDRKRDLLVGFAEGRHRVMVTKSKIAGFGLNWQHCRRVVFAGASHSFEQTFQAIRRCWRFGQDKPVDVHIIRAEEEEAIVANYRRKEADAERLYSEMTERMSDLQRRVISGATHEWDDYAPSLPMVVPEWIGTEERP